MGRRLEQLRQTVERRGMLRGSLSAYRHPSMRGYISHRELLGGKQVDVLRIEKVLGTYVKVFRLLRQMRREGRKVLFVGGLPRDLVEDGGAPFHFVRGPWKRGYVRGWEHKVLRPWKEFLEKVEYQRTVKEVNRYEKLLKGLDPERGPPELVVFLEHRRSGEKECAERGIPRVGLVPTHGDRRWATYVVPVGGKVPLGAALLLRLWVTASEESDEE